MGSCWKAAGVMLERCWKVAGEVEEGCWTGAGEELARCLQMCWGGSGEAADVQERCWRGAWEEVGRCYTAGNNTTTHYIIVHVPGSLLMSLLYEGGLGGSQDNKNNKHSKRRNTIHT